MPAWVDRCVTKNLVTDSFKARYAQLSKTKGKAFTDKYPNVRAFAWATCTAIYNQNVKKDGPEALFQDSVEQVSQLADKALGVDSYPLTAQVGVREKTVILLEKERSPSSMNSFELSFTNARLHTAYRQILGGQELDGWSKSDIIEYHVEVVRAMTRQEIIHSEIDELDELSKPRV